jgi:hypothetical protein
LRRAFRSTATQRSWGAVTLILPKVVNFEMEPVRRQMPGGFGR